ncbi:hypothetical protein RhiirC2_748952 [Rhizophagus irregularis]|uniref:Uncharacterized protein n=1 Tax=Rhizophagus irregularis TaxID=588596 RepID=A0A2N1N5K8_9GLOM|nr:hypothetical protein RhiirC2_748952 [Rhizophagus irregularis]
MSICNIVRHKGVIGLLKKRNNVNFKRFYYLTDNADDRNAYISTEKNFDELYECVIIPSTISSSYDSGISTF